MSKSDYIVAQTFERDGEMVTRYYKIWRGEDYWTSIREDALPLPRREAEYLAKHENMLTGTKRFKAEAI